MNAIFLFLSFFLFSSPAFAAPKSLEERVKALEVQAQQKTPSSANVDVASFSAKVDALMHENLEMKGAIDTNRHLLESQQQDISKQYQDLDMRLRAQEERLKILLVQVEKVLAKSSPQLADESRLYQAALDKVEEGSYLEAASAFTRFLERYPKSSFAAQARFWVGESYFETHDYQRAIKEYQAVVSKYPKDEKAKKALLRQGECFWKLSMKDEAKLFLQKVQTDFPQSSEALEAAKILQNMEQPTSTPAVPAPLSTYPDKTIQEEHAVPADEAVSSGEGESW